MRTLALTMRFSQSGVEQRDSLATDWSVYLNKVLPHTPWFSVPNVGSSVVSLAKSAGVGGIILTGGDDLGDYPERDITERALISWALENQIPILGVCRGAQMLNDYFGGTLQALGHKKHAGTRHDLVWIKENIGILNNYLVNFAHTDLPVRVNSYHNQAIFTDALAKDCKALAVVASNPLDHQQKFVDQIKDSVYSRGIVEAFCHKKLRCCAVMWHPEREETPTLFDTALFHYMFGDLDE